MKRWLSMAALLCVATATPLVAQQASAPVTPAPRAEARTAVAGPRLQPEVRRVEPVFENRRASASPVVEETHTIRMTTLVLILVIVILVLLIAK